MLTLLAVGDTWLCHSRLRSLDVTNTQRLSNYFTSNCFNPRHDFPRGRNRKQSTTIFIKGTRKGAIVSQTNFWPGLLRRQPCGTPSEPQPGWSAYGLSRARTHHTDPLWSELNNLFIQCFGDFFSFFPLVLLLLLLLSTAPPPPLSSSSFQSS